MKFKNHRILNIYFFLILWNLGFTLMYFFDTTSDSYNWQNGLLFIFLSLLMYFVNFILQNTEEQKYYSGINLESLIFSGLCLIFAVLSYLLYHPKIFYSIVLFVFSSLFLILAIFMKNILRPKNKISNTTI